MSNHALSLHRSIPLAILFLLAGCPGPRRSAPPTVSLVASPSAIEPGQTTTLSWQSTDTATCTLAPELGKVALSGTVSHAPQQSLVYVATCQSANGQIATASAPVTVLAPVAIAEFFASIASITSGDEVKLTWKSRHAIRCRIEPGLGDVPLEGEKTVSPSKSTTYELTCEGHRGPSHATADVVVDDAPLAPREVSVAPGDGTLTVGWKPVAQATSYNLYLAQQSGVSPESFDRLAGGILYPGASSPFTLAGLVNGRRYYLVVTALNGTTEGPRSTQASGVPVEAAPVEDPLFGDQWHLRNVGQEGALPGEDLNVSAVWAQKLRGEGIRVAVVDDGLDRDHEDLRANVATWLYQDYLEGNESLAQTSHGTSVAGLIAARDLNGLGGRGVAPRANLVGFNTVQAGTQHSEADAMARGAERIHVSNNSWGPPDGTGHLQPANDLWQRALETGLAKGRGGRGTVYVWAAGNGGDPVRCQNCRDNSNFDGMANHPGVVAVAALGDNGKKSDYSEEGANVWISAPSTGRRGGGHGITTTDITGVHGYNPPEQGSPTDLSSTSYTQHFGGTSAAAPMVSGVVALMLQANPLLSWRDVRLALAKTASLNDPSDSDWSVNGAGYRINHKYGFGRVNAQAAVAAAVAWTPVGPLRSFSTQAIAPMLPIPDADPTGLQSTIQVAGSGIRAIEFVRVRVEIANHRYAGDLEITLRHNQTGTSSRLAEPHDCFGGSCPTVPWYFGSVRHLGEGADGSWTLAVADRGTGDTGALSNWQIIFYGRE